MPKILREYVIVEPVDTVAALAALDVTTYSGAAISCFVRNAKATYVLDRTSSQTADGVNILQPAVGNGRWFRVVSRLEDFSIVGTGGVANAYTASFDERLTAYEDGQRVYFKPDVANTGASTINLLAGLPPAGIKKILHTDGSPVDAGEMPLNKYVHMIYNSSADAGAGAFEMVTQPLLRSRTYITQTASDVLSADQPLSLRHTGLLRNTNGTGVLVNAIEHTDFAVDELLVDTGAADAYAVAIDAGVVAYASGLEIYFTPANPNTGASTIDVNTIGAQSIKLQDGSDPAAGDLAAGAIAHLKYDGTNFQLMNPQVTGTGAPGAPTNSPFVTYTADATLTNEFNLGALTTGLLKHTVAAGVSAPATAIQGTDYYEPGGTDVAVADGGTGASTAADARTNLGLVIGTDVQAYDATLQSLSALGTAANKFAYTTGVDTWAEADITAFGRSLVDDADAATARSTLGVVIGTDVQAYDAGLASIAGLVTAADQMIYTTALDTYATTSLTAFARTILDDANQAAVQTTLALVPGTDVQAYDATLAALATYNTNGFVVQTAADTFAGRTITGTASEITISNGDGVAANPVIGIADNAVLPGTESNILATGTTAQRPGAPVAGQIRFNSSLNSYEYYNGSTWATFATGGAAAPVDAQYFVATANGTLTNEVNFGALTTGLLKHAVAAGVSTPATAVEGTDYYAPGGTDVAVADGGTGASTAGGARTNLGLVIGTDVQAYDATLNSIAALGTAADKMLYTTGVDTWAESDLTAFARTLFDDASASAARTTLGAAADADVLKKDGSVALTADWDISAGSFTILVPTPALSAEVANKGYVDTATAGLGAYWTPVRVQTQAELSATYNNGAGTLTATANGAITVDGIALSLNDRVLVTEQATGSTEFENGLYSVTTVGDGSNPYVLTRTTDADVSSEFTTNKTVFVEEGTCTGCVLAYDGPDSPTLGTTAISFTIKESAASVPDGSITTAKLANSAVTASKIANGAVENTKLADATLKSIADLGTAADKMIYTTGVDTWAEADLTSFARTLLDDANATAARSTLGLVIGTDVQAYDATLQSLSALGTVADRIAYTTGVDTWAESPISAFGRSLIDDATAGDARTTLGLGTIATQSAASVSITGGTITGTSITVLDNAFTIQDNADNTKQVVFELGGLTTATTRTYTAPDENGTLALTSDLSSYQPLNSNLTDISGLAVTDGNIIVGNGANFVAESGATARASLGLTIGTDVQAYDAGLADIAGLAVTDGNIIVGNGTNWVAESGATARASLGLTIGTDVEAFDAGLSSIAGLTTAADTMIYTTALDTYATTTITAFGRSLVDDADAATARGTLGLVIGTNVQAYDAGLADIAGLAVTDGNIIVGNGTNWVAESGATARASLGLTIGTNVQAWSARLDDVAGLTPTDSNFIVGNGTNWVAETGATVRTSLGLGTIATQDANNVSITGGSITGSTITVADDVFTIQDNADATKQVKLELSGLTTATTRTYTAPDADGELALVSNLENTKKQYTQATHGFTGGEALYHNGTSWVEANANDVNTAEVVGFVEFGTTTTNTFYLISSGYMSGWTGLTAGQFYFLDTTSGAITSTVPDAGYVKKPVGMATSATELEVNIMLGIVVTDGTSGSAVQVKELNGDATIDLTNFPTGYDWFEIELIDVLSSSNGDDFNLRTSTDGGASFDNGGGDYGWLDHVTYVTGAGGTTVTDASQGDSLDNRIKFNGSRTIGNASGRGINGKIIVYNPSAATPTNIQGELKFTGTAAGEEAVAHVAAKRLASSDVDAVQLYFTTGNAASGKVIVKGYNASTGVSGQGNVVVLDKQDANASSSIDFVLPAEYDYFIIEANKVVPTTDNVGFGARTSADSGATYDSGASDYTLWNNFVRAGSVDFLDSTAESIMDFCKSSGVNSVENLGTGADENANFTIKVVNPSAAATCEVTWKGAGKSNEPYAVSYSGRGVRNAAAAVTNIRLQCTSGTIASGQFVITGYKYV